jgi:hypothetical protein
MAAQLARCAERGGSSRRSSDAFMGGAVQRKGRVNMRTFKMLMVVLFMMLLQLNDGEIRTFFRKEV